MDHPTRLAGDIVNGLIHTGRAIAPMARVGSILRLGRRRGGFYWISLDGEQLSQGETLRDAEPLQSSFRAAMAETGKKKGPAPVGA